MSVQTISGHVLLPHRPDWRSRVEWSRRWQTEIRGTVDGGEERQALRPRGRNGLRFRFLPFDDIEHQLFMDRLREALRLGRAVVPFWGRGVQLAENGIALGQSSAYLREEPTFEWASGDSLWIGNPVSSRWTEWELVTLDTFPGDLSISLSAPVLANYPPSARLYPMIAGRVELSEGELLDDWRGGYTIRIDETVTRPAPNP